MRPKGFGLVELLVAIALTSLLLGGGVALIKSTFLSARTERVAFAGQLKALASVTGLEKELSDRDVVAVLPGSTDKVVAVVATSGTGYPVSYEGYTQGSFRFFATSHTLGPAKGVFLVNGAGQGIFFYLSSVQSLGNNTWQANISSCSNAVPWTENTMAYPAEVVTLDASSPGLKLTRNGMNYAAASTPQSFSISYIYTATDGREQVQTAYSGMSGSLGQLTAIGFSALGSQESNRALTSRLPVKPIGQKVTQMLSCGGTPPPPGLGVITINILPPPPGGGDVTLSATNYTRNTRFSYTYRDVPTGNFTITANEVWSDSLTAWGPNPTNIKGSLVSFVPITHVITYSVVPGTITFSASGVPPDAVATLSATGNSGYAGNYSVSVNGGGSKSVTSAMPGGYTASASQEVSVTRSSSGASWTETYSLLSLNPPSFALGSRGSVSVNAIYGSGNDPGQPDPGSLNLTATGFPSGGSATVSAGPYSATLTSGSSKTFSQVPPGVYATSASNEVSIQKSQSGYNWTEIYTLSSVNPKPATVSSRSNTTVTATYAGPVAGTITFSATGFPSGGSATVSAGPYSATLTSGSSKTISEVSPGVYATSASRDVRISKTGVAPGTNVTVSWTEIYPLVSLTPTPAVAVSSRANEAVVATYSSKPSPGILCYDNLSSDSDYSGCQPNPPGPYVAPESSGDSSTVDVAGGHACVRIVRYWEPEALGLSSDSTATFKEKIRAWSNPGKCPGDE